MKKHVNGKDVEMTPDEEVVVLADQQMRTAKAAARNVKAAPTAEKILAALVKKGVLSVDDVGAK